MKNRGKLSVVKKNGRQAISRFTPKKQYSEYVLVEIELKTGRMHQIRAHAAAIGYPVGGDPKYGSLDANRNLRRVGLKRIFLHAAELKLDHPSSGEKLIVKAPIPTELMKVLERLS